MAKKKLPPIGEHPAFRALTEMLQHQSDDRINKLLEALEDGTLPTTASHQEEKAGSQRKVGNHS